MEGSARSPSLEYQKQRGRPGSAPVCLSSEARGSNDTGLNEGVVAWDGKDGNGDE